MKYKIVLLIILFPVLAHAQKISPPGPHERDSLIRNVMKELKESWTLGVDSNSNTVDIAAYNKYKKLFDTNARVFDDLNFRYYPGKASGSYKIDPTIKSFDEYTHDVALEVTRMEVVDDTLTNFPYKIIVSSDSVILEITRNVYVEKPAKYVLKNIDALADSIRHYHSGINFEKKKNKIGDSLLMNNLKEKIKSNPDSIYKFLSTSTLHLTLIYTNDSDNVLKITRIENISNTVDCINDDDKDGVLNASDSSTSFGSFTAHGKTDDDLDGFSNAEDRCGKTFGLQNSGCPESYFLTNTKLDGSIGVQFISPKINLPELNKLGYHDDAGNDAMDVLQSQKGTLKNPTQVFGVYAGGNYIYYFGKNAKQIGVSIGFNYSSFVADYELTDTIIYTYKSFDGNDHYRRQVTISSLKEEINYAVLNFPVLFNYRFKIKNKWVINIKAGPSFMLFRNKTNYNATIDIGGIYQVDTVSKNKMAYYNFFDAGSTWNVYMTSSGINQQNTNPGASVVFSQLNGSSDKYDFVSNRNYRDQQKLSRGTAAFNFSLDGYKASNDNSTAIRGGIHFIYAPTMAGNKNYKPIDRSTDEFNSIFNSSARSAYFAFGVSVGFVYYFKPIKH